MKRRTQALCWLGRLSKKVYWVQKCLSFSDLSGNSAGRTFHFGTEVWKIQNFKNGQKIQFLPIKSQFCDYFYFFNFKSWRNKSGLRIFIFQEHFCFFNFKSWRNKSGLRILIFQVKNVFLAIFDFWRNKFFFWKNLNKNGPKIHFLATKSKFWDHFCL